MSDLVFWQAGGVFLISLVLFLWGASAKGITLDFRPPGSSLPPNLY
jgi:hypothetical protein